MKRSSWFGALLALGGTLMASRMSSAHPRHVEAIEEARREPLGETVTVVGTVTVPSGAFDGGFALQQDDAGLYVADSLGGTFALGEQVKVTGVLVDSFGLRAIQPVSVHCIGRGKHVEPERRATGAVGEQTEGQLLRLRGAMRGPLVDDSPYGFKLDIDDGSGAVQVFLYPGTGISTAGLVDGAEINVVCFSNQYETTYECDPRVPADLHVAHRH